MNDQSSPGATTLTVGDRVAGLNHIARIRALYWEDDGKALRRFISDMQDKRDPQYAQNSRALAALYFLANIPASRHGVPHDALTRDEKKALIGAMNQFRAMVSLFPKHLTMPL